MFTEFKFSWGSALEHTERTRSAHLDPLAGFTQLINKVCIYQWPNDASLFILETVFVPTCHYCLNFTKFGQLILKKVAKIVIVATRSRILRL